MNSVTTISQASFHNILEVKDVAKIVVSFLPYKDMLNFSLVSKQCKELTEWKWKQLLLEKGLEFTFTNSRSDKDTYIQVSLLLYSLRNEGSSKDPLFQKSIELASANRPLYLYLKQRLSSSLLNKMKNKKGGEFFLQALLEMKNCEKNSNKSLLRKYTVKAIDGKAYQAGHVVLKTLKTILSDSEKEAIAFKLAEHKKFKALKDLLSTKDFPYLRGLQQKGLTHAPLLARLGTLLASSSTEEADRLLTEAISGYHPHVPVYVLTEAALVKSNLQQWDQADALYQKAINAYEALKREVPPQVYSCTAFVKLKLCQFEEAYLLWNESLLSYGADNMPADSWACGAIIQLKRNELEEAEGMFNFAIEGYQKEAKEVPPLLWAEYGDLKTLSEDWLEADKYYEKAIQQGGDLVSSHLWIAAGFVKYHLQDLKKADEYSDKAIQGSRHHFYADVGANIILLKSNLKQWIEVNWLGPKVLKAYQRENTPAPASVLECIAFAKLNLKRWKESLDFYDQAIRAHGNQKASDDLLANKEYVERMVTNRLAVI